MSEGAGLCVLDSGFCFYKNVAMLNVDVDDSLLKYMAGLHKTRFETFCEWIGAAGNSSRSAGARKGLPSSLRNASGCTSPFIRTSHDVLMMSLLQSGSYIESTERSNKVKKINV